MIGFDEWIRQQFKVSTTQGWAKIIAYYTSDDLEAMEQALELLAEYAATQRREIESEAEEGGRDKEKP